MSGRRFFDANGRELHVGSRVVRQRVFSDGPSHPETVRSFDWSMNCGGWSVIVGMLGLPVRALGDPDTWICPDLQLDNPDNQRRR